MKAARAEDFWRGLYGKRFETAIVTVEYRYIRGLGDGTISFAGPITPIIGGNGAGKTTLLEAVLKSLDFAKGRSLGSAHDRFEHAELMVSGSSGGAELTRTTNAADPENLESAAGITVTFLDPAAESTRIAAFLDQTKNFQEVIEALTPRELDADELEEISYLVGKRYTRCAVYEVEEFGEDDVFPYFIVEDSGGQYGSESMGLGEMALHITNWYLQRVSADSVVLLEEPETHISPRSQEALMNRLAHASVTRNLWVALTTHAPGILRRIPREHIRLVYRAGGGSRIVEGPSTLQLDAVLGVRPRFTGVILVEDRTARDVLHSILHRTAPELLRVYELVVAGSEAHVMQALQRFPKTGPWLSVVGVFDGDQRGRSDAANWPYTFLAGDGAPEALLRKTASIADLAAALARDPEVVDVAFAESSGLEDHDWLQALSQNLHVRAASIVDVLVATWLASEGAAEEARRLTDWLVSQVNGAD